MKKHDLKIIFENKDVLILDKESGIAAVPSKGNHDESKTLLGLVKKRIKSAVIPVTSLDPDATGIVIFAKNKESYAFIAGQIKDGSAEKTFYALVNGIMIDPEGTINKPVMVSENQVIISETGVPARTKYAVKEKFRDFTFIEAHPLTSLRSQIRVHFWSEGNPLAVDKFYASAEPLLLSSLKRRYKGKSEEKPLLSRLPLHFAEISFVLPGGSEKKVFESPLPKDMEITLKQLRKYNKASSY